MIGLDKPHIQGGVSGKGRQDGGEYEDRGGHYAPQVGRRLQRCMAKPKPATGSKGTVIPTGSGGQDEGPQLPHVVLWAQRALQGLSTKHLGMLLVKVGCVQTTSNEHQQWHRDMLMELLSDGVEHVFSSCMRVNLDCSVGGRKNIFVFGFGFGVPSPW